MRNPNYSDYDRDFSREREFSGRNQRNMGRDFDDDSYESQRESRGSQYYRWPDEEGRSSRDYGEGRGFSRGLPRYEDEDFYRGTRSSARQSWDRDEGRSTTGAGYGSHSGYGQSRGGSFEDDENRYNRGSGSFRNRERDEEGRFVGERQGYGTSRYHDEGYGRGGNSEEFSGRSSNRWDDDEDEGRFSRGQSDTDESSSPSRKRAGSQSRQSGSRSSRRKNR